MLKYIIKSKYRLTGNTNNRILRLYTRLRNRKYENHIN